MRRCLLIITAIVLSLVACTNKQPATKIDVNAAAVVDEEEPVDSVVAEESQPPDSIQFETFSAEVNKGNWNVSISYSLPVINGNDTLRRLCDSIIGSGYKYDNLKKQLEDSLLSRYDPEDEFGYEEENNITPIGILGDFIFYQYASYSYSEGGAHGYYSAYCRPMEISTGKTLVEEDIFNCTEANMNAIGKELRKKLNEYVGENMDDYPYVTMLNGNFYFDHDSLTYMYEPMSVAPYAAGEPQLKLSKKFLKPYLKMDGPLYKLWYEQ